MPYMDIVIEKCFLVLQIQVNISSCKYPYKTISCPFIIGQLNASCVYLY